MHKPYQSPLRGMPISLCYRITLPLTCFPSGPMSLTFSFLYSGLASTEGMEVYTFSLSSPKAGALAWEVAAVGSNSLRLSEA